MGRRISRGSPAISCSFSSSLRASGSRPSFFTVGLLAENMAVAEDSAARARTSSSVSRSAKKSRSVTSTPACERASLTLRQVVQRFQV